MKKQPPKPLLLFTMLSLMVLIWTVNFIAGKIAIRHMPVLMLVATRLELAALLMAIIYFLAPRRTKLDRRDIKTFLLLGILGVVINQGGFTLGLKYTTVGHSAIIIALAPVVVLLLAGLSRLETITRGKAIGMALCFIGVIVLGSESVFAASGAETLNGDIITFASVTGYSIYAVLAKRVVNRYDTITMNFFTFLTAAIVLLPLAIHEWIHLDWGSVGWVGWTGLAYMAVLSSVVGYLIYYWALRHMDASRLAATTYIEPLLAMMLGAIFLGEHFTAHVLTGGALVLTGVYITERSLGEDALPPEPA
jgi:drug/metabolite transporter (DMT)-like permease